MDVSTFLAEGSFDSLDVFFFPHFDGHSVDFDVVFNGDDEAAAAFDDAGFDKVETVWIDLDVDVRCLYGKFSGSCDGRNHDGGVFAGGFFENLIEALHAFGRSTTLFEQILDFRFGDGERNHIFFVFFCHFGQVFVDLADDLVVAFFSEGFSQYILEHFFLCLVGDRRRSAEAGIDEFVMEFLRVLGEIEDSVDVGAAVIESREQEAGDRWLYPPVSRALFDVVGGLVVGEAWFGEFYRTNAAEDVVKHFLGGIEHFLIVICLARNVVGAVNEDDVVILAVVVVFNDFIIEVVHNFVVGQFVVAQLHEECVGAVFAFVVDSVF